MRNKNRPESSSLEKLKIRNQYKSSLSKESEEKEDSYSDEEIADDPDEGDDGSKNLENFNKTDSSSEDEFVGGSIKDI